MPRNSQGIRLSEDIQASQLAKTHDLASTHAKKMDEVVKMMADYDPTKDTAFDDTNLPGSYDSGKPYNKFHGAGNGMTGDPSHLDGYSETDVNMTGKVKTSLKRRLGGNKRSGLA